MRCIAVMAEMLDDQITAECLDTVAKQEADGLLSEQPGS